ncbi:MAG TPA: CDP-alcohol phosphatidyltransferase family protein [Roseiflexaceae bacterium]
MSVQKISSVQGLRQRISKQHREPPWNRVVRRISIYFTWVLVHTPISANGVTALFLLSGLLGAGVFAIGTQWAWIVGTLLIWLSVIFDFCDGEVARFRQESSWFGDYFEETVHAVLVIAMYCGISLGVWRGAPSTPYPFGAALLAAGFTLVVRNDKNLLLKSLFQYYGIEKMQRIAPSFTLSEFAVTRNMNRWLYLIDIAIFDFGFYFVTLPLAAIANRMDLFLYFYAVVRTLATVYMFMQSWKLQSKYRSSREM